MVLWNYTELSKEEMAYELGDIVWYLDETALAIGKSLESNLIMNIDKLKKISRLVYRKT